MMNDEIEDESVEGRIRVLGQEKHQRKEVSSINLRLDSRSLHELKAEARTRNILHKLLILGEPVEERGRLALSLLRSSRVVRDLYGYAATFEGRLFSNE